MPDVFARLTKPPNATDQPIIAVPTLNGLLRPWDPADGVQVATALADEQIRHWNLQEVDTLAQARAWVDEWTTRWAARTGASWAVVSQHRPEIVLGQVAFRSLYLTDGLAELSYWVVRPWRRRRVATEAMQALASWSFADLGLERLQLVHSVRNLASCSVALRTGFAVEGVMRHLQRHADGFHDMCLHARIRDDDGRPIHRSHPSSNGTSLARLCLKSPGTT